MEMEGMSKDYRIVVSEEGFVHFGKVKRFDCPLLGTAIRITNAFNIRRFGTTTGLGQLALEGPQEQTILDKTSIVDIPIKKIVHLLLVNEEVIENFFNHDKDK